MKSLLTTIGFSLFLCVSLMAQANNPIGFSGKWVSQKFEAAGIVKLVYTDKTPGIRFFERAEISFGEPTLKVDFDGWFEKLRLMENL